ncbi:hypothetical protein HK102_002448 [Quaeritorhiza haematococci]|nr:hypothetical protein HK102_002448 [Quaeritorhiza haematococci]
MDDVQLMEVKETNAMNKSILSMYTANKAPLSSSSSSPAPAQLETADTLVASSSRTTGETTPVQNGDEATTRKKRSRLAGDTGSSSSAKKSKVAVGSKWPTPKVRLSDLGGVDHCIEEVLQLVGMPLKHPEVYIHLGIQPPRGILLHGPPGCGKTMLANAIAGEIGVPFVSISAPSIVSGMSGESEKKLREIFEEAKELAPCLLFIDEIDAITPKRDTVQREMERRIVAQLLTCMDDLSLEKTNNKPVLLIGATNRPDALDPALRRAGRFDREISMGVPDEEARMRIIQKLCSKLRLSGDFDFRTLAKLTPGYVGADLNALTAESGLIAVKRIFSTIGLGSAPVPTDRMDADTDDSSPQTNNEAESEPNPPSEHHQPPHDLKNVIPDFLRSKPDSLTPEELNGLYITNEDFLHALKNVQPSSKREGFATIPDVSWEDIGALSAVRDELRMAVVEPIRHPEYFLQVGITAPMGVLLYGPPGCGKTLLAKAVANESHCNFISIKGPELLNKYVGESERAIRQVFARAQASSPCVIFFDELDALCPARSNDTESQSSSRLVNTLLTEMDGMQSRRQVYVIAATNRPDMIDPAMLRPGRLDKTLYIDLPTPDERHEILKTIARRTPLGPDVDLGTVANDPRCDGFSGADLAALVREAAVAALKTRLQPEGVGANGEMAVIAQQPGAIYVFAAHFDKAFGKVQPSVSQKDRKRYNLLRRQFGSAE